MKTIKNINLTPRISPGEVSQLRYEGRLNYL
jgi:hypothetical protein